MNQVCVVQRASGERQAREERQLLNPRNSCPVRRSETGKLQICSITGLLMERATSESKAVLKVHLGCNSQG